MKNIWKKYKELLTVIIYLTVLSLACYFGIKPFAESIESQKREYQEIIAIQEYQSKKLNDLTDLKNNYEVVLQEEENIRPLLSREDTVELIEKIERLAEETENIVELRIIEEDSKAKARRKSKSDENKTILETVPVENYLVMQINLFGNYNSFFNFLRKIENVDYYLDVVSFDIAVNEDVDIFGNTNENITPVEEDVLAVSEAEENSTVELSGTVLTSYIEILVYIEEEE